MATTLDPHTPLSRYAQRKLRGHNRDLDDATKRRAVLRKRITRLSFAQRRGAAIGEDASMLDLVRQHDALCDRIEALAWARAHFCRRHRVDKHGTRKESAA